MPAVAHRRRPRGADDASTRERILQIALEAFAELGFDGASTRAIATRAGVNQGLIPYYFGTKDALWREAVDRAFAELRAGLGRLLVDDDDDLANPDRLARLIRQYVRFVASHPEFVRMMHEEGKREGKRMRWLVDRHVRPLYDGLTHIFSAVGASGGLTTPMEPVHFHYIFAGAVGTLFHQAPECRRLTGIDPSDDAVIERQADTLVGLFLGDPKLGRDPATG